VAHLKNRSDLEEFPDGGRATLVRRYSPALTQRQLGILLSCPHDRPAYITPESKARRHALTLVRYHLLERDPASPNFFRVTSAGQDVAQRWTWAGFMVVPVVPHPL
jgi:hypothetical protein